MLSSKPVILIVEDEEAVQVSYATILEKEYDLLMAETGEEALEILNKRTDIRAIFLDYILPGMDGLQFMERFKEGGWDIPVIVVTGRGSEEVAARFSEYEIFRYLTKPFRVTRIVQVVEQALQKYDLKRDNLDFRHKFDTERLPFEVQRAVEFIVENFHRNIGVIEIAAALDCSHRHLSRLFRRYLEQTPHEFLEQVRMSEAKKLIETTHHSVKIVAQKCGFGTEWHFIKTFKKTFGRTPTEHRREFSQF